MGSGGDAFYGAFPERRIDTKGESAVAFERPSSFSCVLSGKAERRAS